jgi:hypothetical protein
MFAMSTNAATGMLGVDPSPERKRAERSADFAAIGNVPDYPELHNELQRARSRMPRLGDENAFLGHRLLMQTLLGLKGEKEEGDLRTVAPLRTRTTEAGVAGPHAIDGINRAIQDDGQRTIAIVELILDVRLPEGMDEDTEAMAAKILLPVMKTRMMLFQAHDDFENTLAILKSDLNLLEECDRPDWSSQRKYLCSILNYKIKFLECIEKCLRQMDLPLDGVPYFPCSGEHDASPGRIG